jgi:hypothetical protein
VAFALFAVPDDLFAGLVEASGLPSVLAAAQPPLGNTARFAAIAVASTAAFLFVWLVLRALGGKPVQAKRRTAPVPIEVPLPRIRRADAHPDAPARRPLLAGLELGVPFDEDKPEQAERQQAEHAQDEPVYELTEEVAETPSWLQAEVEPNPEVEAWAAEDPDPEVEAWAADEPNPQVEAWAADEAEDHQGDALAEAETWPEADDQPEFEASPGDEPEFEAPAEEELSLDRPLPSFMVTEQPAEEPDWLDDGFEEPAADEAPLALPPGPEAEAEPEDSSISNLMQRLESGLNRRERADWMVDPDAPVQPKQPRHALDDRLRSAINDLQKLATRGG